MEFWRPIFFGCILRDRRTLGVPPVVAEGPTWAKALQVREDQADFGLQILSSRRNDAKKAANNAGTAGIWLWLSVEPPRIRRYTTQTASIKF